MREHLPVDHVAAVEKAATGGNARPNLRKSMFPINFALQGKTTQAFQANDARKLAGEKCTLALHR